MLISLYDFSEPSTPGPLLDNSNLDASAGSISPVWTGSDGEVSKYMVAIFDGNVEKISKEAGTYLSTVIGFDGIKNGYRYNVSIIAHSKAYDGDKIVESDPYIEEIKTLVQGKFKFLSLHVLLYRPIFSDASQYLLLSNYVYRGQQKYAS